MSKLKIEAIKDNLVTISGKHNFQFLEVVKFKNRTKGIILKASVDRAEVGLIDLNDHDQIEIGDECTATGKLFTVPIYNNLKGSIVDTSLNELIISEKRNPEPFAVMDVFAEAQPIYTRKAIDSPMPTGLLVVDAILPIGKGQKQLILGDKGTGKTAIAMNAILAQVDRDTVNIFVGIGKKREEMIEIYSVLKQRELMHNTIIVSSAADETAVAKWLTPYVATAIAEYYQSLGQDVLVIFDDLTNHADAYRELSLLAGSAPGREAYPGDVFYTHSRLLERAGAYQDYFGGGSITMLPIAQTLASDISGYIPTNLISITDGQIFTSSLLFNAGKRPAINIGLSVSRIGSAAQEPVMREVSKGIKGQIAKYERQKQLSSFSINLDRAQLELNDLGRVFEALAEQKEYEVVDYHTIAIIMYLLRKGYLSFYKDDADSLNLIKNILMVFFAKDVLGQKMRQLIRKHSLDDELLQLYTKNMILPLLKYHLLSEKSYLSKNARFVELYKEIRNDGRVLLAYERRGLEKGIAYEYNQ